AGVDGGGGEWVEGTFSRPPRVPHTQLGQRLLARQPWLQPPDDADTTGAISSGIDAAKVADGGERRPEVRCGDREPSKGFRHHTDNLERRFIHHDRAGENGGIAREVPGPGPMAEDDRPAVSRFVV